MKLLPALLMVALAAPFFAPAALAEEVCQPLADTGVTACAETTGDPTTGSFGVALRAGPLHACVVVLAACPEALP